MRKEVNEIFQEHNDNKSNVVIIKLFWLIHADNFHVGYY